MAAPTITTGANHSIIEAATAVVTMAATGTAPIAWSITDGADQALFGVDEDTGALAFLLPPDYEDPQDADTNNVYVVEVTATNGEGSDDLTLSVTVLDVDGTNSAPGPILHAPVSIPVAFSPAHIPQILRG